MALSAEARSTLYQTLSPLVGEKAIEEMLSNFPARDVDEPVTKEHLDLRFAQVDVRFAELHDEFTARFAQIDVRFAELRTEMGNEFRSQQRWMIGLAGVFSTVIVIADKFIH